MTDTIRLAEDQLKKIMAAILTASGNYSHPMLVVDEVARLCDEVDGNVSGYVPRVGCHVRFLQHHWAVKGKQVMDGDILRVVTKDTDGDYWTEPITWSCHGICLHESEDGVEFLP